MRTSFIFFSLLVSLLTAPQIHADPLGKVVEVSEVGQISLDTGEKFMLWGLAPIDHERFREVLLGRSIYCADYGVIAGADPMIDCFLFPKDESHRSTPLRALDWLPELGFARLQCSGDFDLIVDAGAYGFGQGSYACHNGNVEFTGGTLGNLKLNELQKILQIRKNYPTAQP